ncbi:hypothetical protein ACSSBL_000126 [Salmonella enterica subsp. enterica serovar Oranienburg]|nr:hypothetical protein [Salmonella enterica subsp. enterica serovar Agona]EHY9978580.1 hypothetical protein [Salmonella enterica]EJB5041449.1 hypothetical protein [Salmonella enterica]HBK8978023.1 hypothetical protein [Salmonella enterica subsp. enterica serovar Bareilly]
MAWQGIPFSIEKMEQVVTSSVQAAHIVLDKVPAIIVDTLLPGTPSLEHSLLAQFQGSFLTWP